jgi:hypothetical protein
MRSNRWDEPAGRYRPKVDRHTPAVRVADSNPDGISKCITFGYTLWLHSHREPGFERSYANRSTLPQRYSANLSGEYHMCGVWRSDGAAL